LGKSKSKPEDTLERNLGFAFAYASIAVAFQAFAMGAMGGINLDLCRLLGSKMLKSEESGDNLSETWWIFVFGPIIGVLQAKLFVIIEAYLESEGGAKGVEDAGDNKASTSEANHGAIAAVELEADSKVPEIREEDL